MAEMLMIMKTCSIDITKELGVSGMALLHLLLGLSQYRKCGEQSTTSKNTAITSRDDIIIGVRLNDVLGFISTVF